MRLQLGFCTFCRRIRTASSSRADFAIRSFATSYLTPARVASPGSFLVFLLFIEQA
jgi:hypothetical protein